MILPALLLAALASAAPAPSDCSDGAACFDGARARSGSPANPLSGAGGVIADARGFRPAPRPAFTAAPADATRAPGYVPNDPPTVTAEQAGSGVIAWLRSLFGGWEVSLEALTHADMLARAAWNRLTPVHPFDPSRPGRLTIHHTALPRALADTSSEALDMVYRIQREHRARGYDDIGYNFLVDPSGRVIEGRGAEVQGSHAGPKNNAGNVGISLMGQFEQESPTAEQEQAVARLGGFIVYGYSIDTAPDAFLSGHRDQPNEETACPGRNAEARLPAWRVAIRASAREIAQHAADAAQGRFVPGLVASARPLP